MSPLCNRKYTKGRIRKVSGNVPFILLSLLLPFISLSPGEGKKATSGKWKGGKWEELCRITGKWKVAEAGQDGKGNNMSAFYRCFSSFCVLQWIWKAFCSDTSNVEASKLAIVSEFIIYTIYGLRMSWSLRYIIFRSLKIRSSTVL